MADEQAPIGGPGPIGEGPIGPRVPDTADTTSADKWYQPLATPVRRRAVVYAAAVSFIAAAPGAGVSFNWFTKLDEQPVRLKRITAEEGSLFGAPPKPEANDQVGWYKPLELPTRRTKPVPQQMGYSFVAAAPSAGVAYNWFTQLDEPLRIKRTRQTELGYSYFPVSLAETITIDKWWQQLTIPTRRRLITEGAYSAAPPLPQANDQIGWHRALETPTRAKRLPPGAIPFEARNAFPVVPWGWYAKLDEPLRIKRTPTGQVGYIFVAAAPGAGVAYNWFTQLDEPLRIKRTPKTVLTWGSFTPAPTEIVTIDKWWRELDRPTRRTKPVPQQMGYSFVAAAPGQGVAYNWFAALDTPTRRDQRRIAFQQFASGPPARFINFGTATLAATTTSAQVFRRSFIFDPTAIPIYFVPPTAGAGNELNWWPPLNEPVRPRLSIRSAQQWALSVPPRLLTTTLENAWFQRLSEPVRLKVGFGKYPGGSIQGNINPIVPFARSWVDEPRRLRRVNYSQFSEAPYGSITLVETITVDKWWRELDRPVRRKLFNHPPALTHANINPIVPFARSWVDEPRRLRGKYNFPALVQANIEPVVPIAWQPLHVPHRLKGRINYPALAQQAALYPDTVQLGKFTQWWRQLDLPVREWRKVAWQWSVTVPPTGVAFFNEGGPADESERVVCVPSSSRVATEPDLLRVATIPLELRTATVPELLRVVDVPDQMRTVNSNDYRDRACHDI